MTSEASDLSKGICDFERKFVVTTYTDATIAPTTHYTNHRAAKEGSRP